MAKKNSYQQANEDIVALMVEAKSRNGWSDRELGKLIGEKGITEAALRNKRSMRVLPNMRFCDVMKIAEMSGYDIRFVKRGICG